MDLETYELFQVPVPEDMKDSLTAGGDIQYIVAMGRKKITRV